MSPKRLKEKVIKQIATSPYLFLFLDYDGTLTPIVAKPGMASLSHEQREILLALSRLRNVRVGVISGRVLEDVKRRVNIPGIIYAGNHGLELEGAKTQQVHPAAIAFRHIVKKLITRLRSVYASLPAVMVEDKTFSVSVHYRQLSEDRVELAKVVLLREIGELLAKSKVVFAEGKKVWEIRPPTEWNKGKTVLWLLGHLSGRSPRATLPVYIGDDVTDEDAFKAIGDRGTTVRVTENPSAPSEAQYYLRSSDEVYAFFKKVIKLRQEEGPCDVQR